MKKREGILICRSSSSSPKFLILAAEPVVAYSQTSELGSLQRNVPPTSLLILNLFGGSWAAFPFMYNVLTRNYQTHLFETG
jgi:hypothetical protein